MSTTELATRAEAPHAAARRGRGHPGLGHAAVA